MRNEQIVIAMDCGATTITTTAVDIRGRIVRSASLFNHAVQQPGGPKGWVIWDLEEIWSKLCQTTKQVCQGLKTQTIRAAVVTTFGVDGSLVNKQGDLLYPVISWQDSRTAYLTQEITRKISAREIFARTGYQFIPFNTLLRLLWLKKNAPNILDKPARWMMMPGLINFRLTGEFSIDPTSASTMMAMNMRRRDWDEQVLSLAGVDSSLFPEWVQPGEIIGHVTRQAARQTSLPQGIPVVTAGHDTQCAVVGSGAREREVVLSSGTWEVLMLRTSQFEPNEKAFEAGLIIECDPVPGMWNPQIIMMASGVLEWIRKHFYCDVSEGEKTYRLMISEATKIPPGSDGVIVVPSFFSGTGPTRKSKIQGTILGLTINTERSQVFRAALEGLSFQLAESIQTFNSALDCDSGSIRVIGGGSKNNLWNQIRADVTGLPVIAVSQGEATILGAALLGFVGTGLFSSVDEGQREMDFGERVFEPSSYRIYQDLLGVYLKIFPSLEEAHERIKLFDNFDEKERQNTF